MRNALTMVLSSSCAQPRPRATYARRLPSLCPCPCLAAGLRRRLPPGHARRAALRPAGERAPCSRTARRRSRSSTARFARGHLMVDDELLRPARSTASSPRSSRSPSRARTSTAARSASTSTARPATAAPARATAWSCSAAIARPPTYHIDRLRQAPVGYFFDVMTNGFGVMPDYRAQMPAEDRWRIVGLHPRAAVEPRRHRRGRAGRRAREA